MTRFAAAPARLAAVAARDMAIAEAPETARLWRSHRQPPPVLRSAGTSAQSAGVCGATFGVAGRVTVAFGAARAAHSGEAGVCACDISRHADKRNACNQRSRKAEQSQRQIRSSHHFRLLSHSQQSRDSCRQRPAVRRHHQPWRHSVIPPCAPMRAHTSMDCRTRRRPCRRSNFPVLRECVCSATIRQDDRTAASPRAIWNRFTSASNRLMCASSCAITEDSCASLNPVNARYRQHHRRPQPSRNRRRIQSLAFIETHQPVAGPSSLAASRQSSSICSLTGFDSLRRKRSTTNTPPADRKPKQHHPREPYLHQPKKIVRHLFRHRRTFWLRCKIGRSADTNPPTRR